MGQRTSNLAYTNVSDASFRLWINEIHNALLAFGWTQTADTGQINFSTVTRPTAINTYQGFAVYQMGDSLQATCAVFMRLDFGTAATTDGPAIKVGLCIGSTNGSGTLTGNVATQYVSSNNTATTTTYPCRCAGSSSSFRCNFWGNERSNSGFIFAIERDLNTSGAETSLGVNFLTCSPTGNFTTSTSQFLELAGGTGPVENKWYALLSAQGSQSDEYGRVGVAPVRCTLGPFRNPMKTILLYSVDDYYHSTTNPVTIYGVSHTYLMTYAQFGAITTNNQLNGLNTGCGIAMLWE
jgi:hypothetical protein